MEESIPFQLRELTYLSVIFQKLIPVVINYLQESLGSSWTEHAEKGWLQTLTVINTIIFSVYDAESQSEED